MGSFIFPHTRARLQRVRILVETTTAGKNEGFNTQKNLGYNLQHKYSIYWPCSISGPRPLMAGWKEKCK
jgi:hypothetical protein